MLITGIDTSQEYLGFAFVQDDKVLVEKIISGRQEHENLLFYLEKTLQELNLDISQIELFSIIRGPGSFTGLRIGISAIKALSYVLRKPLVTVVSLDVLAYGFNKTETLIVPIIDAKRGNLYSAIYRFDNDKLILKSNYLLTSIDKICALIDEKVIFIGNGVKLYEKEIRQFLKEKKIEFEISKEHEKIRPSLICNLGKKIYLEKGGENIHNLTPFYLYPANCSIIKR